MLHVLVGLLLMCFGLQTQTYAATLSGRASTQEMSLGLPGRIQKSSSVSNTFSQKTRLNSTNEKQETDEVQTRLRERITELQALQDQRREELRVRIEEARNQKEGEREQQRQKLRERLIQLGEQQKLSRIEDMDHRLNLFHQSSIQRLTHQITVVEEILNKIITSTEELSIKNIDVSEPEAAIGAAQAAITAAKSSLEAYAGATYVFTVPEDGNFGTSVRNTIADIREGTRMVQDRIKTARTAVKNAVVALAGARNSSGGEIQNDNP